LPLTCDRQQLLVAVVAGAGWGPRGQPAAEHPVWRVRIDQPDRPGAGSPRGCDLAAGHRVVSGAQPRECFLDSSAANSW